MRRRKSSHILNQYCIFSVSFLHISNVDSEDKLNKECELGGSLPDIGYHCTGNNKNDIKLKIGKQNALRGYFPCGF